MLIWAAPVWSQQSLSLPEFRTDFQPVTLRYQPVENSNFTANISFKAFVGGKIQSSTATILGILNINKRSNRLVWGVKINDLKVVSSELKTLDKQKIESYLPVKINVWRDDRGKSYRAEIDDQSEAINKPTSEERKIIELQIKQHLATTFQEIFPINQVSSGSILYSQDVSLPLGGAILKIGNRTVIKGELHRGGRPSLLSETKYHSDHPSVDIKGSGYSIIDVASGILSYSKGAYSASLKLDAQALSFDLSYDVSVELPKFTGAAVRPNKADDKSLRQRLSTIKRLLDAGLITEKEAATKRKSLLSDL